MTPLYRFVNSMLPRPFVWGECDCVLMLADWVLQLHGVDPAADLRLTYSTAGECQRVTRFFTDPVGLFDRCLTPIGIGRTEAAAVGDIGIVTMSIEGRPRPYGAICLGSKWAVKAEEGVTAATVGQVLQAWGVGYAA